MNRLLILEITFLAALAIFAAPVFARPLRVINDNDTVVLHGSVHPHARPEFDSGPTDYSLPMERMVLSLKLSPARQSELEQFLGEQQDPASPNFHRWLTPEEFGERFGPDREDVDAINRWLISHGFTVEEVAKGRTWINFSGAVSDIERAFHARIHDYQVNGRLRHANANDPTIPRGLADLVTGIVSLHNFPRKPMNSGIRFPATENSQPDFTSGSTHYLSPGDFATIYNVNALYSAGIDGTGQIIAIVGRTHPSNSNWTKFRSLMGLSANPPLVILNGADPGDLGANEDGEADLDVEWSGAVAKNASIKFVISKSTNTTDGVDLSAQYIVNNNVAPVMSTSFGSCESDMGPAENNFFNNLWQQAAAQGITSFVSSGDSGASGCDPGGAIAGSGLAVNGLASTPYNVSVGGTQFNEGGGTYWNTVNAGYNSAIGYIPEVAWNESGNASGGSGLWSTGGGASTLYSKPSWQVTPGVPADGKRDIPDVSLTAAGHDGYLVRTQGALYAIGGTSASSPSFAGLMALIVQKTGQPQGNANIRFYQLGSAQYGSGGAAVFHDTTSGNNSVPGVTGYSCTTGYDLATGLGSVDAYTLVNNWTSGVAAVSITAPTIGSTFTAGATIPLTATASAITPFTISKVEFYNGTTLLGSDTASPYTYSWSNVPAGAYTLTAKAYDSLGGISVSAAVTVTVTGLPIAPTPISPTGIGILATVPFTFNAVAGASGYTIWLQNYSTGVGSPISFTPAIAGCASGAGTCSYTPAAPFVYNNSYGWQIEAVTPGGISPWSNVLNFVVTTPPAPAPLTPTGNGILATAPFTFNAVAGTTGYTIWLQDYSTGVGSPISFMPAQAGCASGTGTCTYTPAAPFVYDNSYGWQIRAETPGGYSPWSNVLNFVVTAPPAPTPLTPTGNGILATAPFTFNAVVGTTGYTIWLQNFSTGTGAPISFTPAQAGCASGTGTCTYTPAAPFISANSYGWQIRAVTPGGISPWSNVLNFVVQ